MTSRDTWVDFAKAIGIILVVFGHVTTGICNAGLECDVASHNIYDSVIYLFHMPLFFFLAGLFFVQSLNHRGLRGLLENKVNLVLYPYVLWSLLQGAIELLFAGYKNGSVTVGAVLAFPWAPRMQLWFLYTLFWVLVIGAFVFNKVKPKHHGWVLLAAVIIYLARIYVVDVIRLFDIARCLVYFVIGICFVKYQDRYFSLNRVMLPLMLALAVLLQWYFHVVMGVRDSTSEHWIKLPLAMACIMTIVSLCWSLSSSFKLNWLAFLGASSMSIFLMHTMIAVALRAVMAKGFHINSFVAHTVVATVAGLLLPLLVVKLGGRVVQYLFYPPPALELGRKSAR